MILRISTLCGILLLGACNGVESIETTSKPADLQIQQPAPPKQVTWREVNWTVLNEERLRELLKEAENNNKEIALIAVTPKGYENLSLNVKELERFIRQQKEIILYYEDVTKPLEEDNQSEQ